MADVAQNDSAHVTESHLMMQVRSKVIMYGGTTSRTADAQEVVGALPILTPDVGALVEILPAELQAIEEQGYANRTVTCALIYCPVTRSQTGSTSIVLQRDATLCHSLLFDTGCSQIPHAFRRELPSILYRSRM
jgi:hypothetical protein